MITSQLKAHIISTGREKFNQSANEACHSTETAFLLIKNEVHLTLSRGEATTVVLLDQSAAFDTTDQGTHLDCLSFFQCWWCTSRLLQVLPRR